MKVGNPVAKSNQWTSDDINWYFSSASGAAKNPAGWLYAADRLGRAAGELRKTVMQDFANLFHSAGPFESLPADVGPTMLMLLGYELENLVKGLIIAQNPSMANNVAGKTKNNTKLFGKTIQSHLGPQLFRDAGITLSPDDEVQVMRLRTFLEWGGRYPVAVDSRGMMPANPGQGRGPASYSTDDLAAIDALIDRIRKKLSDAAGLRAAFDEAAILKRLQGDRPVVLSTLSALRKVNDRGVTLFVDDAAPDEPGSLVSCGGHASFSLNRKCAGAICQCGIVYYVVFEWDASLQRETGTVNSYPPTN